MLKRRSLISAGAMAGVGLLWRSVAATTAGMPILRAIPKSGELLPAIGMGSWITFQVGDNPVELAVRREILRTFFTNAGAVLDSSPMYGRAEAVLGQCIQQLGSGVKPFRATKVWILGRQFGINQMEHSENLWGHGGFDLMQVHNLLDWDTHLPTLQAWKRAGRIRYVGVTTSHGRRHAELEEIMGTQDLDFVQFTYNLADRVAEARLLPLAAERGIAVIINRPFQQGGLFERVRGRPLPGWAGEIGCMRWAQVFLKYIVSHPAVTCAIPATSQVAHMAENIAVLNGALPDQALRRRMVADFENIV